MIDTYDKFHHATNTITRKYDNKKAIFYYCISPRMGGPYMYMNLSSLYDVYLMKCKYRPHLITRRIKK